ncbi:hypothetical protein TSUD_290510 [Trifolium subterraneum]|uniref:Uncharacterized protein n=1 Tax=Trifolium subterraneum TaxID=3900 RepID=A0A2Z6N600_TRISU|nr:hypothetical protein TSUD_290510 [Trifolium subterraneum]
MSPTSAHFIPRLSRLAVDSVNGNATVKMVVSMAMEKKEYYERRKERKESRRGSYMSHSIILYIVRAGLGIDGFDFPELHPTMLTHL